MIQKRACMTVKELMEGHDTSSHILLLSCILGRKKMSQASYSHLYVYQSGHRGQDQDVFECERSDFVPVRMKEKSSPSQLNEALSGNDPCSKIKNKHTFQILLKTVPDVDSHDGDSRCIKYLT